MVTSRPSRGCVERDAFRGVGFRGSELRSLELHRIMQNKMHVETIILYGLGFRVLGLRVLEFRRLDPGNGRVECRD